MSVTDTFHKRNSGFKVGDEVAMRVSKTVVVDGKNATKHEWDDFTIADLRYHLSWWQYKLKDSKDLLLGDWFPEGSLKSRT